MKPLPYLPPSSTLGILGGGQLGRMFAIEARRMGYKVVVFTDDPSGSPAGQVADVEINASYDDAEAMEQMAALCQAVTFEFENLPPRLAEQLRDRGVRVCPSPEALATCQHRAREKAFLAQHALPCAPWRLVHDAEGLSDALRELGTPVVMKTAAFGYDGKGQKTWRDAWPDDLALQGKLAERLWKELGEQALVVEAFVDFVCEVSVVAARDASGNFVAYPLCENEHCKHILHRTLSPARVAPATHQQAFSLAQQVAEALDYCGTLAVEFFLLKDGSLLINEIAPRPHNSGHHTIEANPVSQFGQQLRALTGAALGETSHCRPSAMLNILGDLWDGGPPNWSVFADKSYATLHLYGKALPKPGRKMGHLTLIGENTEEVLERIRAVESFWE